MGILNWDEGHHTSWRNSWFPRFEINQHVFGMPRSARGIRGIVSPDMDRPGSGCTFHRVDCDRDDGCRLIRVRAPCRLPEAARVARDQRRSTPRRSPG